MYTSFFLSRSYLFAILLNKSTYVTIFFKKKFESKKKRNFFMNIRYFCLFVYNGPFKGAKVRVRKK